MPTLRSKKLRYCVGSIKSPLTLQFAGNVQSSEYLIDALGTGFVVLFALQLHVHISSTANQ